MLTMPVTGYPALGDGVKGLEREGAEAERGGGEEVCLSWVWGAEGEEGVAGLWEVWVGVVLWQGEWGSFRGEGGNVGGEEGA